MRGTQARRLRQEAITRYNDEERTNREVLDNYKSLYHAIKDKWTRLHRIS